LIINVRVAKLKHVQIDLDMLAKKWKTIV